METNDNQRIAEFFDDCVRQELMLDFSPAEEAKVAELVRKWRPRPGERIVEPGCGAGRLTATLANSVGHEGRVLAFDLSPAMLETAVHRELGDHVEFRRASVVEIPAEDECFDQAICFNCFPHFEDFRAALIELKRVLRPGGSLWVNHLDSRRVVNDRHREVGGAVISHMLPDEAGMRELFEDAGLEVLELIDSEDGYSLHARKPERG